MARRGSLLILTTLAALALTTSSASAGHARHCANGIKAHHTTCRVAEKVLRKWADNDYSGNNMHAGGTGWHCWFKGDSNAFNCFSNLSGWISGHIERKARSDTSGTVAQSTVRIGDRKLHQDISVYGNWMDYHVVAKDPDGLYPYCVTIRFEKRVLGMWKPLARQDLSAYHHECIETPAEGESDTETFAAWDTVIYPAKALYGKFHVGDLRVHGITDLGGDLSYRR